MLSDTQRKAIFVAVKKSFLISGYTINASCIYSNQTLTSYPAIILYYQNEEDQTQNALGSYIGNGEYGQRSLAWLSINIYAKNDDAKHLNAHQIGSEIAKQLSIDIRNNWGSLASDTVWFRRKSSTKNLTSIDQASGSLNQSTDPSKLFGAARFQFDIFLAYNLII